MILTAHNKFVIIISEDRKCAMFDIKFYEDEHGYSDVKAFIKELREKSSTEIEKAKRELEDYKRRYE